MGFTPSIVTTSNVKETLLELAKKGEIEYERLGFDLLGSASYYKQASSRKWTQIDEKVKATVLQLKYLAHKSILFKEQYKIKVYQKKEPSSSCRPKVLLRANQTQSKVILLIKSDSKLTPNKACLQELIHEVRRKLLLSNFMLGLFTTNLQKALLPVIELYKKHGKLPKDIKIVIAQALEPETNHAQKQVLYYLQKEEDQRTAYEKGVDEDELLIESHLPIISRGGRSCQGKYLPAHGPVITSNDVLYHDDTIKMIATNKSLKFYALKAGYLEMVDNHISVSNSLSLKEAGFKTTGSITVGGHRDIDLKITSNDRHGDAVTKGVAIDVSNIDVNGSVAENTSLKAESVNIGAHTHKTTQIVAEDEASVYLHRGNLKAKDAKIVKLEQGLVEAETVTVEEILGGEIRARHVKVEKIHSNAKIYASESIEITHIKGDHNKFYIAPNKVEDQEALIEKLEAELAIKKKNFKDEEKNFEKQETQYNLNYERIDVFKKQVTDAIKRNTTPPKAVAIRVKQYGIDTKRLFTLKETLAELKEDYQESKLHLEKHQNILLHATITYHGRWDGKQEIFYEHFDSDLVEKYIPKGDIRTIIYSQLESNQLVTVSGSRNKD